MHPLVLLAKRAVENYIKNKKVISIPDDLPEEFLKRKTGVFVSINKNGKLRGCLGTYLPLRKNIAQEVIYNAIGAATEDYRFSPIDKEELDTLSYTVYILSEPVLVKNISELNPKKYGIIVRTASIFPESDVTFNGHFVAKTGLLLPDIKGIESTNQQISIACQKGEIDPGREKILIYKFTVQKYE